MKSLEKQKSADGTRMSRMRKSKKPSVELHREYLDMDTDEEELVLRRGTPEPQPDAASEPERPEFTEEELDTLVRRVKDLATVLPSLSESSWSESCLRLVREYFQDPKHAVLSVYFVHEKLRALLDLPYAGFDGLVYVLRTPGQVYRPGDPLLFGSVSGGTANTVLKFVGGLYAPLAFKSQWPKIMEDKIFSAMNDFLTRATDVTYTPMGMPVLYVPLERAVGESARKAPPGLLDRLEKVARTWMRQVRGALSAGPCLTAMPYDTTSEYDFWRGRYENLHFVRMQLRQEDSRLAAIVDQLRRHGSGCAKGLDVLARRVDEALEEATLNLSYLDILLESCKALGEPSNVEDRLPRILHVIRYIWDASSHYRQWGNLERLLSSFSFYVLRLCVESIDLRLVVLEDSDECRSVIRRSLSCCESYSIIYDRIVRNCVRSGTDWMVDKAVVFKCIKAFEGRCRDVLEICDAISIYGSLRKVRFGCTRGSHYEARCRRLNDTFDEIFKDIERRRRDYAFNIMESEWLRDMKSFRDKVHELEKVMRNLLNGLFDEGVVNVDAGIQTLYTFFRFKGRAAFDDILRDKWKEVWQMFAEEINDCSKQSLEYDIYQDQVKFLQSERSVLPQIHGKYLERLYGIMIDASHWLGSCDLQAEPPLISFSRKTSI